MGQLHDPNHYLIQKGWLNEQEIALPFPTANVQLLQVNSYPANRFGWMHSSNMTRMRCQCEPSQKTR